MDRRTLLAIAVFIGLYYAYVMVLRPIIYPEPPPDQALVAQIDGDEPATDATPPELDGTADSTGAEAPVEPASEPAAPAVPARTVDITTCTASGKLSSNGGGIGDMYLDDWEGPYEVQPIYSWLLGLVTGGNEGGWKPYGEPPGPQPLASEEARFLTTGSGDPNGPLAVYSIEQTPGAVITRGRTADGIQVQRTVRLSEGDPCVMEIDVTWTNPGATNYDGLLWVGMHDLMPEAATAYAHVLKPYWSVDGTWDSYTYPKTGGYMGLYKALDQPVRMDGDVDWFGMSDGYFTFVVVPQSGNVGRLVLSPLDVGGEELLYGHHYMVDGIAAGATVSQSFVAYTGPIDSATLTQIHPDLYFLVDLGWFAFFGRPLLWLLNLFHSFVGNWGLSIILLTVTVKLVFFPLTQMAYQSSQRMQLLQPELKKVREEFADNQEELNKRTMALFRENKVNPIGGCLPMLIQMPIWIALYRVLLTHVDLYHTKFLYLTDLSVQDPYAILPLVVVGLMFAQQQLMPTGNMDPNQARIMKFMPLVFGFLFFTFPSGLVLYIFVNMTLTILQQWFIKRRYKTASPAPQSA